MEEQSVSLNQAFYERIRGCVMWIVILNRFKLFASTGAVVAVIFSFVNRSGSYSEYIGHIGIIYFILPGIAAVLTFFMGAVMVFIFTSGNTNRKEHFINNVIPCRKGMLLSEVPLVAGVAMTIAVIYYINLEFVEKDQSVPPSIIVPPIMYLVFSGLIIIISDFGSVICMDRIYQIKLSMLQDNITAIIADAKAPGNKN